MSVIAKIFDFITTGKTFLIIGMVLNILVHISFLNQPPGSQHVWRQSNTLAVARNFYEEKMNIFETRVDHRKNTNGVTGSHFPSYEFILAGFYKIFGEQFWVHRVLSMVMYFWGAFGLLFLFRLLFKNEFIARMGFWGYIFSPELFYYEINALPDILSLSSSIWGFYYFVKWFDGRIIPENQIKSSHFTWLLSLLFLTLAGLTKLQYLAVGFPIAIYVLLHFKSIKGVSTISLLLLLGAAAAIIPLMWYAYAIKLIETSGLADFGLEIRSELNFYKAISILKRNILSDLPELILNYAAFILLLTGVFYILKEKRFQSPWFYPFLVYALGLIAYHMLELRQMEVHGYYMMPYYPVLLLLVSFGAWQFLQKKQMILLYLLIFAQPVLAAIRIVPARWLTKNKHVPQELYQETSRERLINAAPNNARTIVGPDVSNCIYFYFLHKKGYCFPTPEALFMQAENGKTNLENYITGGAEYLYIYLDDRSDIDAKMQPYSSRIFTEGKFRVYKLNNLK
jgi:hypothetical protein